MASDSAAEDKLGSGPLLEKGRVLEGRYEVDAFIGAGAFAAVYSGRQLNIAREVAIKVLNVVNAWQDAQTRRAFGDRFLREAQTAAQIKHPNVVDIYDYGIIQDLGQPFIVMELLKGWDLEQELRGQGPMEPPRAWRLILGALEALGEGHERGIVHKDLKPSNLFLVAPGTRREVLKVVDFGIARVKDAEEGQRLTGTGQIFGTPQYLAPEYIEKQIATAALDVYQMALILVEMLTGKTVVDIDNPYKCLMIHVNGDLQLPPGLMNGPAGAVLRKALHKDWQQRYPDATAFADALRTVDPEQVRLEVVTGEARLELGAASTLTPSELVPAAARLTDPPADLEDAPPPSRPSPVLLAVAALLILGLLGGVAAFLLSGDDVPAEVKGRLASAPVASAPVASTPSAAPEPPTSAAAPATAPPAVEVVEVEVRTVPEGARVFRGDTLLGASPVVLRFEGADASPVGLRVEQEGYAPATLEVQAKDGPSVEARLEPSPSERPSSVAGRPPKERPGTAAPAGSAAPPSTVATRPGTAAPADPNPNKGSGEVKRRGGMGFVEEGGQGGDKGKKGIGFVE